MDRTSRTSGRRAGFLPALALSGALLLPAAAPAAPEIVDRIVAVVGNEIILLSELDEEVYLAHLRGELDVKDVAATDAYRHEVLDALVDGKLLLEEARRQGMRVTRDDVDRAVDGMIQDVRSRFPSEEAFEAQLAREGSSVDELRSSYRDKLQDQLLVRQLVDRTVRAKVDVPEEDVQAYWDTHRAEIPAVPARLHLSRIVFSLHASSSVDSAAVERARIVGTRLDEGEDFATLARVFSEGPAAPKGGDLGYFQADDLEPVLGDAVRGKEVGYTTPVLVTDRGAHILRVTDVRDDGALRLSQIVFLRDEEAARAAARKRAEAVLRRLEAGEDFAALAGSESDDPAAAASGGDLGEVPLEALEPRYRNAVKDLQPGGMTPVIEDEEGFVILRLDGREGERAPTYEEMHDRIVSVLEQEKGKTFYDELLADAREKTYVELRLDAGS